MFQRCFGYVVGTFITWVGPSLREKMKGTNWKQSGQVYVVVRVIKLLNWTCGMNKGYTNRYDNYLNMVLNDFCENVHSIIIIMGNCMQDVGLKPNVYCILCKIAGK